MLSPPQKSITKKKKATKKQQPTYYQPSIYSFTCRGAYHVSSDLPSSRNNNNYNNKQQQPNAAARLLQEQEGSCRGIRSQLELVTDEFDGGSSMTREWALQDFEAWVTNTTGSGSEPLDDVNDDPNMNAVNNNSSSSSSNTATAAKNKSIMVPPMLVHKQLPPGKGAAASTSSAVLEVSSSSKQNDTNNNNYAASNENSLIEQEAWSCYGSTIVDYLLLKNVETGQETIAAVAPHNTTGLSVRSLQVGPDMQTSLIQFGWLTLVMQSSSSSSEMNNSDHNAKQQRDSNKQQADNNNNTDTTTGGGASIPGQEVPGAPTMDAIQAAQESAQHLTAVSRKVAQHCVTNATWLYTNTTQADFPARTVAAGQRILNQIPKTVEQTASVLSKLAGRMADQVFGSDHDDDDDHHHGGGRGGGRRR